MQGLQLVTSTGASSWLSRKHIFDIIHIGVFMSIDRKRKELELKRVELAKEELEFKIVEREEDIRRLQENIKIQEEKIVQIKEELNS